MNAKAIDWSNYKENSQVAHSALVTLLQNAHAGEKAAANVYWGHAHSLFVTDTSEKAEILAIYKDELHHRSVLFEMLKTLNAKPRMLREVQMFAIGFIIGILSFWGTWFIPMYGAGKLESANIGEYEVAARLAFLTGQHDLIDILLEFAEVEHDHEVYFRQKVRSHFGSRVIPLWSQPMEKENIRSSMMEFMNHYKNS